MKPPRLGKPYVFRLAGLKTESNSSVDLPPPSQVGDPVFTPKFFRRFCSHQRLQAPKRQDDGTQHQEQHLLG